jgi:hypothetical protein
VILAMGSARRCDLLASGRAADLARGHVTDPIRCARPRRHLGNTHDHRAGRCGGRCLFNPRNAKAPAGFPWAQL